VRVWRIAAAGHDLFDGEGTRRFGSRFVPIGMRAVYTSATLSLAALELFVHIDPDLEPSELVSVSADIPDTITIETVKAGDLAAHWRRYPAPEALQSIGRDWIQRGQSAVLRVPSAIIPIEQNYVLNPDHEDFARIAHGAAEAFSFDPRVWSRTRKTPRKSRAH